MGNLMEDTGRLVADIGGTNARFAMLDKHGLPQNPVTLACDDYSNLSVALEQYLRSAGIKNLEEVALALATPISSDQVSLTNRPSWSFSQEQLKQSLGLSRLVVINDYSALALSIPHLSEDDLQIVGPTLPTKPAAVALIGPGTGLGVSGLVPVYDADGKIQHYGSLQGEGGHVTLSPATERERAVYAVLESQYGHVSAERVVSGPGLVELHRVLQTLDAKTPVQLASHEISRRAIDGQDATCVEALNMFCALLGSCAGNLALTLGASGGVYIGGGIVPKLGKFFHASPFRERFEAKGRMKAILSTMPTSVIAAPFPALIGCATALTDT